MRHLLTKWYSEDDPILREQFEALTSLLNEVPITESALEGFLIVCSRFVDEFGNHRTDELKNIFQTDKEAGKYTLLKSLEYMNNWTGGMNLYLKNYPVTIIPGRPAFPQFKIIGIENIATGIYRVETFA